MLIVISAGQKTDVYWIITEKHIFTLVKKIDIYTLRKLDMSYLYILKNKEHPGIIKIGRTYRAPNLRADQLSRQTGTLGQFEVEWFINVPDDKLGERMIKYMLKKFHYQKEFYKIEVDFAKNIITYPLVEFFDLQRGNPDFTVFWGQNQQLTEREVFLKKETIEFRLIWEEFAAKKRKSQFISR